MLSRASLHFASVKAERSDIISKYRHLKLFPQSPDANQTIFQCLKNALSGERFERLPANRRRLLSIGGKTRVESISSMTAKVSPGERVSDTATMRRVPPASIGHINTAPLNVFLSFSFLSPAPMSQSPPIFFLLLFPLFLFTRSHLFSTHALKEEHSDCLD